MQLSNISSIVVTFKVLKFDKFNDVINLQLLNILDISSTFEVSKFVKFNEVNFVHKQNIYDIVLTSEVLKLGKFISYISEQSLNILAQLILLLFQNNSI